MSKMQSKILIGNTIDGMGKKLAKCLSHFGFETTYCANTFEVLLEEFAKKDYDGLIFFSLRISDKTDDFVKECHIRYPKLKIYPIITNPADAVTAKLIDMGATRCLLMPFSLYGVCGDIISDFCYSDNLAILPEIADFLYLKGFPNHLIGFYHLCCAVEKAILNPEMLNKEIMKLYQMTGETMNTTACHVERSIRILSIAAFKIGVKINGEITHTRLKNKELISTLSREYAIENGLFDDE